MSSAWIRSAIYTAACCILPAIFIVACLRKDARDRSAEDRALQVAAFRMRTLIDERLTYEAEAKEAPPAVAERMRAWLAPGEDHPFDDAFAAKLSVLTGSAPLPPNARVVRVFGEGTRVMARLVLSPRKGSVGADSLWPGRIGFAILLGAFTAVAIGFALFLLRTARGTVPSEPPLQSADLAGAQKRLLRAERIAAWRDIAQRIAHEVKNPLSPIQVSIETLRKTKERGHPDWNDIFEESTTTILEEVEHLRRIVTEFSNFARLPSPRPAPMDVSETVTHLVSLHQGGAIPVTAGALVHDAVRVDRGQITQVLVNLVKNAVEAAAEAHMAGGGRVEISMEKRDTGVSIHVDDNGRGVPEAARVRIFEPYHSTKTAGTGLGLAIAHRIVEDHGGELDVTTSPLGGARFSIHLTTEGPPREITSTMTDVALSDHGLPGRDMGKDGG